MEKLTEADVSFLRIVRAEEDGDQPSVIFKVKNSDSVKKFLAESEATGRIWTKIPTDALGRSALRLMYNYDESSEQLTVSRVVMPTTIPYPANRSLAQAVLTCIFEAHEGDLADIYSGLTRLDYHEYKPAGTAKAIFEEYYGKDHPEDMPAPR